MTSEPIDEKAATVAEAKRLGLPFFFTGVPCIHGHVDVRYTSCRQCRACRTSKDKKRAIPRYYQRKDDPIYRATVNKKNVKYAAKNPEKLAAQQLLREQVRLGNIKRQPCERCGMEEHIHAHHDDYSRPLDVMWLCPFHHMERHREIKANGK